jgi:hypothetical protein
MASDVEIARALDAVTAALNEPEMEGFDAERVQQIVSATLGPTQVLTVDDGGGLHDQAGRRVGAIRRTPSGEWITDRQNPAAPRSDAPIPTDIERD